MKELLFGDPLQKEEKKVEYLELIYDLIFVYIIGRNNSLLHHVENGFVSGTTFWNGKGATNASGGSQVSLSTYSGGGGWGPGW